MTKEFQDHIDKFVHSLNENLSEIYYQAFDFSNINDSRTQLMNLNYEKTKVSFLNLDMIADMFQVYTVVHSAIQEGSSKDFSVDVPHRLATTRSIGDALRVFGGFGKPHILVISILNKSQTEEFFDKISQIDKVKKMTQQEMEESMKKNFSNIQQYYLGSTSAQEQATYKNPIGEMVTKMISSKNL